MKIGNKNGISKKEMENKNETQKKEVGSKKCI